MSPEITMRWRGNDQMINVTGSRHNTVRFSSKSQVLIPRWTRFTHGLFNLLSDLTFCCYNIAHLCWTEHGKLVEVTGESLG